MSTRNAAVLWIVMLVILLFTGSKPIATPMNDVFDFYRHSVDVLMNRTINSHKVFIDGGIVD